MKKIFLYLSAAVALTMAGCDNSDDVTKSPAVEGSGVYVGAQVSTLNPNENSAIVIPIYRTNGTEALTVPVSFSAAANAELFTFPTSVAFASGQSKVDVVIPIDVDAMDYNVNYPFTVTLPEDVQTPYGRAGATLNVLRPLTWRTLEPAKWVQSTMWGITPSQGVTNEIQMTNEIDNRFRLVSLITEGYDIVFEIDFDNNTAKSLGFQDTGYRLDGEWIAFRADTGTYDPATRTLTFENGGRNNFYCYSTDNGTTWAAGWYLHEVFILPEFE